MNLYCLRLVTLLTTVWQYGAKAQGNRDRHRQKRKTVSGTKRRAETKQVRAKGTRQRRIRCAQQVQGHHRAISTGTGTGTGTKRTAKTKQVRATNTRLQL